MRRWSCAKCGSSVGFESSQCWHCHSQLGYVPDEIAIVVLEPQPDGVSFRSGEQHVWRCLNAAWGCNWVIPARTADEWCRACRLTRGRPDDGRPNAVAAWASAEAAKRRLVHQLDCLGLAVEALTPDQSNGLMFDFVQLDDDAVTTGYGEGVVTLDLAEVGDEHRERIRRQLDEPFRTVIGHLRHEVGHHYFQRLIGQSDDLDQFRVLFGDERTSYPEALADHYAAPATWDAEHFVTAYAMVHPIEDWAETFAHYLHIGDAIETASAYGLGVDGTTLTAETERATGFRAVLRHWQRLADALAAVADGLGTPPPYPFQLSTQVERKLEFVDTQVNKHSVRRDFYSPI
jgi:hypothetical protein